MSEPRIISPLLDGFALGGSMSSHSGVNCYPAMQADSDERYIVKTISIPASQVQLEALLLTGAYPNAEAARGYFEDLAHDIENEVDILEKLSDHQGFIPYLNHQTVPMEEGVGFEVFLISHYRRTLARYLRRSPLTHLAAVNLGIDLCAALAACRESGYLYVDLKPDNIFMTGEQDFQIGDLGFIPLDSLKYASLPDRCRSSWTPPEVSDAYATLNTTMDTYALGLILYQVYNNGALPFDSEESRRALMEKLAQGEALPSPMYADYEMAQIILKACAYDPKDRWADPNEMGHALIGYMQRNGANPVPIAPPVIEDSDMTIRIPNGAIPSEAVAAAAAGSQEVSELPGDEEQPQEETAPSGDWIDRMDAILAEDGQDEGAQAQADSPSLRQVLTGDETAPGDSDALQLDEDSLSEETAGILTQANELIAHETPDPVVAPEPIEIPMPEPIVPEDDSSDEPEEGSAGAEASEDAALETEQQDEAAQEEELPPEDEEYAPPRPKKARHILRWIAVIVILAVLGAGGYFYYSNYYMQTIDRFTVTVEANTANILVDTKADESLLSVVCVDNYGNKFTAPVSGGAAAFTGLTADTQYKFTLEIQGFHKLAGQTTQTCSTKPETMLVNFNAVTGPDDGSVVLNFGVEGTDSENWTLTYQAEGEAEQVLPFTGHTITVSNLTVGKAYTFTLMPDNDVFLTGENILTHTASAVILAQDLTVTGYQSGSITASWTAPEGTIVNSWTARCYNDSGYDQTLTVSTNSATFAGIDPDASYTVEITAEGMTKSIYTYVTSNPITVTGLYVDNSDPNALVVWWDYEGEAPDGGWLLMYTVDGAGEQHVLQCDSARAVITPVAPGSHYDVTVQTASAVSVFGGSGSADIPAAGEFSNYGLSSSVISIELCKAPDLDDWNYRNVTDADKTSTFSAGDSAAALLYTINTYSIVSNDVTALFVIRDSSGGLACISSSIDTWNHMWLNGHCELEIPTLPSVPGTYTLEIYLDGALLGTHELTIQ